jgi:hypothetical protein
MLGREAFESQSLRYRLWYYTGNLPYSRRQLIDKMHEAFCEYEGVIFTDDGRLWPIPDEIESIMGEDGRWLSLYLERDENGLPLRKVRNTYKLSVLYLYFCITSPETAAKIIK